MIGNPPPLSDSELRVLEKIADAAAPVQGSVRSRAMQDYRAATGVYNVHRLINQIRSFQGVLEAARGFLTADLENVKKVGAEADYAEAVIRLAKAVERFGGDGALAD